MRDYERTVTVTTYDDTTAGITGNQSKLGSALDFDEYAGNPVSITVNDNKGTPKNGQTIGYNWTVTPFNGDPSAAAGSGSVTSGADGTAAISAPTGTIPGTYTLHAYIEKDGSPGESAGDLSMAPLKVKLGNGVVRFDDGSVAQALAGTSK